MVVTDYFEKVRAILNSSKIIHETHVDFLDFDSFSGMIRGQIIFIGGHILEFMEFISGNARPKYRFHFCSAKGNLIFRYDNAEHHPGLEGFPHHKHLPDTVLSSREADFISVFREAEEFILKTAR